MNILIGRKPVLEAINSGEPLESVLILHGQHGGIINAIRIACKKKNIRCKEVTFEKFSSYTSNTNSQGVIALKLSQKYYELDTIITSAKQKQYPLIVAMDSIQDPHNVGAILRSAEAAGVDGVLITTHNSASINETVVKTSAGAIEHLKICPVNNLVNALKRLKDEGFWIVGSTLDNSQTYSSVNYKTSIAIVVGNEEKGIKRLTAQTCDFLVKIPMNGKIQSLNVSVATGIILFEILRQRGI